MSFSYHFSFSLLHFQAVYRLGDFVRYKHLGQVAVGRLRGIALQESQRVAKIEQLIPYTALPGHLRSAARVHRSHKQLYLVEDQSRIVDPSDICSRTTVWLRDLPKPQQYDYEVEEVLYSFRSRTRLRFIDRRHRLPCEYMTVPQHPTLPVRKFFLDIYYDDFGTYRNVYHSLGGVYMQIGNMPLKMRAQIRNHFLIGFVPFGATFEEFIRPLLQDFKKLERGIEMETVSGRVLVVACIAMVTADLPQGNDLANIKRHSAKHGCRACNVDRSRLTYPLYDHIGDARFHHKTNDLFEELDRQPTATARDNMATAHGLRTSSRPLDCLQRDRHRHTPHDAYHSMAGKALRLLDATLQLLSTAGETEWLRHWKAIEKPPGWSRLPNPISHRGSFQFSDGLRLAMIMPFVLWRFLLPMHIKTDKLAEIKERLGCGRDDHVCKELVQLWAIEAKALRLAFQTTFYEGDYDRLSTVLEDERAALTQASFDAVR